MFNRGILNDLICPYTGEKLLIDTKKTCLSSSTEKYPIIDGVASFIESKYAQETKDIKLGGGIGKFDESYSDGPLINETDNPFLSIYSFISCSQGKIRFFKKHLTGKDNGVVLEVGCAGGGKAKLYKRFSKSIVGLDPSLRALVNTKKRNLFDLLIHSTVESIPFPNEYFDTIVSSDVLGHTPIQSKEKAYYEMYRVLKRGGKMIHCIETDSTNFWIRISKKNPHLYEINHIEKNGHIGLELPSTIVQRCLKLGFERVNIGKINAIILPVEIFVSWFDGDFARPHFINTILKIAKFFTLNKYVRYTVNFFLGFSEKLVNIIIPIDAATGLLLYMRKKS